MVTYLKDYVCWPKNLAALFSGGGGERLCTGWEENLRFAELMRGGKWKVHERLRVDESWWKVMVKVKSIWKYSKLHF